MVNDPLPVTGAWRPGDEPGCRQFHTFATDHPFAVESGAGAERRRDRLRDVGPTRRRRLERGADLSRLDRRLATPPVVPDRATPLPAGGTTASGRASTSTPTAGSSCARTCSAAARGATGPASPHPVDGRPYGSRFPVLTIRDMVRHQAPARWTTSASSAGHSVIGGSMGGMQVLEWAITYPRAGAVDRAHRFLPCRPRAADRLGRDRPASDPARPALARWRLLRRRARRRTGRGARRSPARSPR
jgi:homoserine O-acetyltransferase